MVEQRKVAPASFSRALKNLSVCSDFELPGHIKIPLKTWEELLYLEDYFIKNQQDTHKFVRILIFFL